MPVVQYIAPRYTEQNRQAGSRRVSLVKVSRRKDCVPLADKIALTVAEAAAVASMGITKFYEEMNAGRITARKNGRRTVVMRSEIERYLHDLPKAELIKKNSL